MQHYTDYSIAELEKVRQEVNFTDDELQIFNYLSKNRSRKEIALKMNMSMRTLDRQIANIKRKIGK